DKQRPGYARERGGEGGKDDEGIEPRLEVDHHEGVDEHDREDQSGAQAHEGRVHALDLAPDHEGAPPGQRARGIGEDALAVTGGAPETAILNAREDIED